MEVKVCFGESPKAFNVVNVWLFVGKSVVSVLDAKMLLISQVANP